jgi:nitroreductase
METASRVFEIKLTVDLFSNTHADTNNLTITDKETFEMDSPILEAIYRRRSIREFSDKEISSDQLHEIVKAGIWAPSGLNNQPWRFIIIRQPDVKEQIAQQTHYGHIVRDANALIAVYLSKEDMYDAVKDTQSAGACIQNILLAAEALGLGAVWLGQILKNKVEVNNILGLIDNFDLMAIVALGHPLHHNQKSKRKDISELLLKEL